MLLILDRMAKETQATKHLDDTTHIAKLSGAKCVGSINALGNQYIVCLMVIS